MAQIGRHFSLSIEPARGVFCDQSGVFVDGVPLLERCRDSNGGDTWQPRTAHDLNRDLRKCYGVPIDVEGKMSGLAAICRAFNRGDLLHAQIATLHLQIPDPPVPEKSSQIAGAALDLARALRASGLLKEEWDEDKHPRWPAGSPDSVGGQFAPANAAGGNSVPTERPSVEQSPPVITAQAGTLVVPRYAPIPFPTEIPPIPLVPPDIHPRDLPKNRYPDRPGCEEEWAEAEDYCRGLLAKGLLGKGDHRGMGKFVYQCILGQVSERCGGAPKSRGYPDQQT